eukprot:TRINITY_DN42845_c0_g1_i2.p1 TRINITY_DN42845_c0_g1~~TRINITY_DN42845_c0_g1_i2.p1  ORF type:complete len:323 (+),score=62.57 TRINITY_DN42845_c0_g1_i2:94-1062(+)
MGAAAAYGCCSSSGRFEEGDIKPTTPPCCPRGSHGATSSSSGGRGRTVPLEQRGGMNVYVVGEEFRYAESGEGAQRRGLVVLCDVCGMNSGPHGAWHQYVPCFGGDPPHDALSRRSWLFKIPQLMHLAIIAPGLLYRLKKTVDPVCLEADMEALLPFARETCGGGEEVKVGCVGFCFGAWLAARCLARPLFRFAVGFHPAIGLERLFSGNEEALMEAVKRPMLLIPGGNDPANIKPDGNLVSILREQRKQRGESEEQPVSVEFPRQLHGWMTRGADWDDDEMVEDRELALGIGLRFMEHFFKEGTCQHDRAASSSEGVARTE